jgi:hypothetical protein
VRRLTTKGRETHDGKHPLVVELVLVVEIAVCGSETPNGIDDDNDHDDEDEDG